MTNITIKIDGATAHKLGQQGALTTGMVGATVAFEFGPGWEGLIKTAVFRGGGVTRDLVGIGDTVPIPPEVLQAEGYLAVGVEGYDAEHILVIPTTRENAAAYIHAGANASGDPAADPTLPIWAQLQTMIGDLSALDTDTKTSLVAAVNELAAKSGGTMDEETVKALVEQYLSDNPHNFTETDPTVPAWAKQPEKPSYTADEVGALPQSTPIPATAHDIGAISAPPTATVGQTIRVKAVDEDGKPVEWECADMVSGGSATATEEWTLLHDVTLEADTQILKVTFFDKPQRKIKAVLNALAAESNTSYMPTRIMTDSWNASFRYVPVYPAALPATSSKQQTINADVYAMGDDVCMDINILTTDSIKTSTNNPGTQTGLTSVNHKDAYGDIINPYITGIHYETYGTFAAGTRLRIWGVAK